MSWYEAAHELEKYLPWDVQITPGTGGNRDCGEPPLPLPKLEKGVALYDITKAYIQENWGHDLPADNEGWYLRYPMPMRGKRTWWALLRASRIIPRDDALLAASLNEWAAWMQSSEAIMVNSGKHSGIYVHDNYADPDARIIGKWTIRPGEASLDSGPFFEVDGVRRQLLIRLVESEGRTVSMKRLKVACGNATMEDSTLRNHVHGLNRILKKHFNLASNPITSVDGAYRLHIP